MAAEYDSPEWWAERTGSGSAPAANSTPVMEKAPAVVAAPSIPASANVSGMPAGASSLPTNASFYNVGASYDGQNFDVGLDAQGWKNVQAAVARGEDYNTSVLRQSGDGIGVKAFMPDGSGYLDYGVDVATGKPIYGGSAGGQGVASVANGAGSGEYGSTSGLSTAQQALLKALMDEQERAGITNEIRDNASELYGRSQNYESDALRDVALVTGGDTGVYGRYRGDIEADVGRAVADARVGQTSALNTAARQAARYGISMPSSLGSVSSAQASQLASAATGTRQGAIDKYRGLVAQGIGLKDGVFKTSQAATADSMGRAEGATMAKRNMRVQDESIDWAKQLDVTGMARGMPGASNGAYGVAVGAGNSAVQNQMAPGQALIGAMGQSNNTTMQGQQTAMQGTLGVLNAQSNYANSVANSGSGAGGLGSLLGGAASAWTAFSDRRLKENIEAVGVDQATGLTIYEFEYIGGSGERYQGVMADEAEKVMPAAVFEMPDGFKAVNYQMLGIEFKEVV